MENIENKMRKIGLAMNILMGVSLSFFLSLTGLLASGHFELKAWLVSFGASAILSLLIGFFVPVRKIALSVCGRCGLHERTLPFHCMDSLVSDLIYTPLITLLMVALAFFGAKRGIDAAIAEGVPAQSIQAPNFFPMFAHSLLISLVVGYILIFILQPLFLRLLLGKKQNAPEER